MTSGAAEAQQLVRATIAALWQETPSVRGVLLQLDAAARAALLARSVKPGQWLDVHAPPGVTDAVGGYSLVTAPNHLAARGTLELCIKASRHPVAQWLHAQAAVGDEVRVWPGGSFGLSQHAHERASLVVAGGIGITCLCSMLEQLSENAAKAAAAAAAAAAEAPPPEDQLLSPPPPPLLLYSASSPHEFALLQRLLDWQAAGLLQLQLHTTQQHGMPPALQQQLTAGQPAQARAQRVMLRQGRISTDDLARAVQDLRHQQLHHHHQQQHGQLDAYVCGPPAFTDAVVAALGGQAGGLPADAIHTERWW